MSVAVAKSVYTTTLYEPNKQCGEEDSIDPNNIYTNFCCMFCIRLVFLYKS